MAFPTTNATQELAAINEILASVGQAPVTTLDQTNPDVAIAYTTLLQVSREVQAEGWTFNQEYNYKFTPDTNNEILIPNNVLHIDASEISANVEMDTVIRNGKLYDRFNHTYEFTNGPVECDVVWLFDWVDIPKPIQAFITARASAIVSSRIVGDQTQYKILQQNEAYTRALAMEYDTNQADLSFFGKPDGTAKSSYQSFQPFKALYR
jgi:hypothetical protein